MFHVESRHIMLIYCNLSLSFLLNTLHLIISLNQILFLSII